MFNQNNDFNDLASENIVAVPDQQLIELAERLKTSSEGEFLRERINQRLNTYSFEFLLSELVSHAAAIGSQRISSAQSRNNTVNTSHSEKSLLIQQSFDLLRKHYDKILRRVPDLEANLRHYLTDEFILLGILECEERLNIRTADLAFNELTSRIGEIFVEKSELGLLQLITEALTIPANILAHAPVEAIDPDRELFAPIRMILDPQNANSERAKVHKEFRHEELRFLFGREAHSEVIFEMRNRFTDHHLSINSGQAYHMLNEFVSKGMFGRVDGYPWPVSENFHKQFIGEYAEFIPASIENPKNTTQISPEQLKELSEKMHAQIADLDDLDADVLDMLSHFWLREAEKKKSEDTDATVKISELLETRGLLPKKGGQNRRGGFSPNQREAIERALEHIQNLWLNIAEVDFENIGAKNRGTKRHIVQSRAFIITDRIGQQTLDGELDVKGIVFRPGKNFARYLYGPGRQTALLSIKALQYDPKRRIPEKRLTRYLSWQWRIRAKNCSYLDAYTINTLLEVVGEKWDAKARNKARKRERIEQALDNLRNDGVIANWEYQSSYEGNDWIKSLVVIEPTMDIIDYYSQISRSSLIKKLSPGKLLQPINETGENLGQEVRRLRDELRLSILQSAEEIGIKGKLLLSLEVGIIPKEELKQVRAKIEKWFNKHKTSK